MKAKLLWDLGLLALALFTICGCTDSIFDTIEESPVRPGLYQATLLQSTGIVEQVSLHATKRYVAKTFGFSSVVVREIEAGYNMSPDSLYLELVNRRFYKPSLGHLDTAYTRTDDQAVGLRESTPTSFEMRIVPDSMQQAQGVTEDWYRFTRISDL